MIAGEQVKATNNHGGIKKCPSLKKKKGTGPMNVIKVAMHMLKRSKSGKKIGSNLSPLPLPLNTATNDALTRLVGSVRPLHLQDSVGGGMVSPPPPPPPLFLSPPSPEWGTGGMQLVSPGSGSEVSYFSALSPSSSSTGGETISRYASVQSFSDLGITDEEGIVNEELDAYYDDGIEGDELIDSKAEMFITQFYRQMSLNSDKKQDS